MPNASDGTPEAAKVLDSNRAYYDTNPLALCDGIL